MGPAERKIESTAKNPRALHIKGFQKKASQLSYLRGVDGLLIFLPPNTSTNVMADLYHSLNPARRPDPNQERRRMALIELFALNKKIKEVRERIRFLESVAKQNAENLSHKGGDPTSSAPPTVVGNAPADHF